LDYGTLRVKAEEQIGGIMALLKSMKQRVRNFNDDKDLSDLLTIRFFFYSQQIVDFVGPMLTDDSTVTLINDYYQEFKTQLIRYDEIKDKVKGRVTSVVL